MGKLCRLTVMAFADGESRKASGHYDDVDLLNGIEYCRWLQDQGLSAEPMDRFDLAGYIQWAQNELRL